MMWYRVFGSSEAAVSPHEVLDFLQQRGFEATGHFRGDDQGWFHAAVLFGGDAAIDIDRYLCSEEGIRAELNSWAAWLESLPDNPHQQRLMQHLISSKQLFTLALPAGDDPLAADICLALCGYFARAAAGVYQIDGLGFFGADGNLLIPETE